MVTIQQKSPLPGKRWFLILEERTGLPGIADIDPATGRTGVRTGVFFVTDEWLRKTDLSSLIINTVLSHQGNEEDRVPDRAGPYIDEFGHYVYSTGELGHKINGRHDRDNRYDRYQELPRGMAGAWDEDLALLGGETDTAISALYRV